MNQEIEKLITIAAKSGKVTDRQRGIIRDKAISLGEDADEAELILDLSLKKQITPTRKFVNRESTRKRTKVPKEEFDFANNLQKDTSPIITEEHKQKKRTTAALLAFFLGNVGAHHFYLGKFGKGITCILFSWTLIPAIIGIFASLKFFFQSDKQFRDSLT